MSLESFVVPKLCCRKFVFCRFFFFTFVSVLIGQWQRRLLASWLPPGVSLRALIFVALGSRASGDVLSSALFGFQTTKTRNMFEFRL